MNTKTNEAEIIVHDDVPMVTIIREFDASPDKVFRAHTEADLFAQWIGPEYLSTTIDRWECRSGGEWRYVSAHDDEEYAFRGCFHDVRPEDGVIVQTFSYEDMPDGVVLERLELSDLGGGRTRLTATSLVDSFETRDAFVASGMEVGVQEGYRKLDRVLAAGE